MTNLTQSGPAYQRVPDVLAACGLAEVNPLPRVGRRERGVFTVQHCPEPAEAWQWDYVEFPTAETFPAIMVDVDDGYEGVRWAVDRGRIPPPSVSVIRLDGRTEGRAHIAWFLRKPVHRYASARPEPLAFLGSVADYLTDATPGADHRYPGILMRNPVIGRIGFRRSFTPGPGYSLGGLSRFIPSGWRRTTGASAIGRGCHLFTELIRYAGSHRSGCLDTEARRLTGRYPEVGAYPGVDVAATVAVVERYRAAWRTEGHRPEWIEKQRARGHRGRAVLSVKAAARRERTRTLYARGWPVAAILEDVGITRRTLRAYLAD